MCRISLHVRLAVELFCWLSLLCLSRLVMRRARQALQFDDSDVTVLLSASNAALALGLWPLARKWFVATL